MTFSQYNHIQNFEKNKLFHHFANLIKIRSTHLLPIFYLFFLVAGVLLHERPKKKIENREQVCRSNYTPDLRRGRGYSVLPLSVCLSVRPSKIFFFAFFSATIDGRNLIFGHKLYIGTPYRGKRFLDLADSYFLFADLVCFYIH